MFNAASNSLVAPIVILCVNHVVTQTAFASEDPVAKLNQPKPFIKECHADAGLSERPSILPPYLYSALKKIECIEPDWDGEGALVPTKQVVMESYRAALRIYPYIANPIHVAPAADGTIFMILSSGSREVELWFGSQPGKVRCVTVEGDDIQERDIAMDGLGWVVEWITESRIS